MIQNENTVHSRIPAQAKLKPSLSVHNSNLTRHSVIDLKLLELSCRNHFNALIMWASKLQRMTIRSSSLIKVFTLCNASRLSLVSLLVNDVTTIHQKTTTIFEFVIWNTKVQNSCRQISGHRIFRFCHGSSKVLHPLLMMTITAIITSTDTATSPGTATQIPAQTTTTKQISMVKTALAAALATLQSWRCHITATVMMAEVTVAATTTADVVLQCTPHLRPRRLQRRWFMCPSQPPTPWAWSHFHYHKRSVDNHHQQHNGFQ